MDIQTYRRIDSFNGVTVYELGELEYPFRDFIEKRGVDLGAISNFFAQHFSRYDIPYDPVEALPLLPSGFEYTRDGNVTQVDDGIAFSNSVDALINFARKNLVSVDHPKSIAGQFSGDGESSLREKSDFLRQVQSESSKSIPYDAQPLVYLPDKLTQQESQRRSQNITSDFFVETRYNQQWIIFKYKTVNDLLRNPRRFKKKSTAGDDIDIRHHDISELEPIYVHQQDLSFDKDKYKIPRTWNVVAGCKDNKMNRQYIWTFEDRAGTALTAGELPVELCETFEEGGRQIIAPEKLSFEAPLRFLEPSAFVGADLGELRDLKSTDLPDIDEMVDPESELAELLDGPIYVQDARRPLNFHSLYLWRQKKRRDEELKQSTAMEVIRRLGISHEDVPQLNQYSVAELSEMTLEKFLELTGLTLDELKEAGQEISNRSIDEPPAETEPKLLAKILQQTQQSLFHPDQPPAGFDCMNTEFDTETIWFGLCEPVYHG
ncbi:MAG: hypothetical protein ABEK50_00345 [bacterium]